MHEINNEIVREFLLYDPESGIFTWKNRDVKWFKTHRAFLIWNKKFSGKNAGYIVTKKSGKRYLVIGIFDKNYYAHRLACLYMTGDFPSNEVDHENGNGADNRWVNLRLVTKLDNMKNIRKPSNNTSGVVGVTWDSSRNKWAAQIEANGIHIFLGRFDSLDCAASVRKEAEIRYVFHVNHGETRPL